MTKKSLFISIVAGLVFSACQGNNNPPGDYLSANIKLYDPKDISEYVEKNRMSKSSVLDSLAALKISFKNSYIGYNLKKSLIGKSGDEIFTECENLVQQGPESISSVEANDLILQCLAKFQDSHIDLDNVLTNNYITSPVSEVRYVNGKIYISRIREKIIKKLEELQKLPPNSLLEKLKVGTEVVLINDRSPELLAKELEKYISESNPTSTKLVAIDDLFTRNYNYPSEKEFQLQLRSEKGIISDVTLPYLYLLNGTNIEAATQLKKTGIISTKEFNEEKDISSSTGFTNWDPVFNKLLNKRTYVDEKDDTILITGTASMDGKNVCYMKLTSFVITKDKDLEFKLFEEHGKTKFAVSLTKEVKNFLGQCDSFSVPVVLDLRNNTGGNADLVDILFSFFINNNISKIYTAKSQFIASGNNSFILKNAYLVNKTNEPDLHNSLILTALNMALDNNQNVTDWMLLRSNKNEEPVFKGPLFTLTNHLCVSACDIMAQKLKISGRSKLIGTPTRGTGFGFTYYEDAKTTFRDPLNLYEIRIPNFSFGNFTASDETDFNVDTKNNLIGNIIPFNSIQLNENKPIIPDITLDLTVKDLTNNFEDYAKSLEKFIFKK